MDTQNKNNTDKCSSQCTCPLGQCKCGNGGNCCEKTKTEKCCKCDNCKCSPNSECCLKQTCCPKDDDKTKECGNNKEQKSCCA